MANTIPCNRIVTKGIGLLSLPDEILLDIALCVGKYRNIKDAQSISLTCWRLHPIGREALVSVGHVPMSKIPQLLSLLARYPGLAHQIERLEISAWSCRNDSGHYVPDPDDFTMSRCYEEMKKATHFKYNPLEWYLAFKDDSNRKAEAIAVLLALASNLSAIALNADFAWHVPILRETITVSLLTYSGWQGNAQMKNLAWNLLRNRITVFDMGPSSYSSEICLLEQRFTFLPFTNLRHLSIPMLCIMHANGVPVASITWCPPRLETLQLNNCYGRFLHIFKMLAQGRAWSPSLKVVRSLFASPLETCLMAPVTAPVPNHGPRYSHKTYIDTIQELEGSGVKAEFYFAKYHTDHFYPMPDVLNAKPEGKRI